MKDDKFTFTSEKEKQSYLKFVKDEYRKNKIGPFQYTRNRIEEITDDNKEEGYSKLVFISLFLHLATKFIFGPISLFSLFVRLSLIEFGLTCGRGRYRGILPTILKTPFIFANGLIKKSITDVKHLMNVYTINKCDIQEENDEDEKNSKENKTNMVLTNVRQNFIGGEPFIKVITRIESMKDRISLIKDPIVYKKCLDSLYEICSLLERVMNLSRERRVEALNFAYEELGRLSTIIIDRLEMEKVEDKEGAIQLSKKY